ncbi:hypothetical protein [Granulosicoccus antarcticus]|uniref:Peptidase M10 metallopeptidase domain-containing protein n=1 Tax=Granulosicoccus antarcticus IMCC3135 TaxID=1192854 RepID=A0A2Z2NTB5_9GAMM|nr:hypothetical protein [Granulosicoccus antarcticus]ASJ74559.1 hypothetical protein IMCC3135_22445 [Granulosicoccus antarcticus IMCC3135]
MIIITKQSLQIAGGALFGAMLAAISCQTQAGSYIFGNQLPGGLTYPSGYSGDGGALELKVCITPGTAYANEMVRPVMNNIAIWNKQESTSSNLRNMPLPSNSIDFESVSLHEMGHCVGLGHPNMGLTSSVSGSDTDFTQSNTGADSVYGFSAGVDNVIGSADDVRGDDVNLHYFNRDTNNPFAENRIVDASTYTRDETDLPVGDLFPANADRSVSSLSRYRSPFTEASMQQGTFGAEIQRTLGHDDVSTLRYGRSGLDGVQGSADDYTVELVYGGISAAPDCDISVAMDSSKTGVAVCSVSASLVAGDARIISAEIYFNTEVDWYFNDSSPCNESVALTATVWKMMSLPCLVGVSTSDTVQDVLFDDLGTVFPDGTTNYDTDWVVFEYEYLEDGSSGGLIGKYEKLALTDSLKNGIGYWVITNESGKSIDVQGEYSSQVDTPLFVDVSEPGTQGWNMVGNPFRFPVVWADTLVVDTNGDVLFLNEADPAVAGGAASASSGVIGGTACTDTSPPAANCKVAQYAFVYNDTTGRYDTLSTAAGVLDAFDAAWVFAGGADYAIRYPMSSLERTTP